MIIYLCGWLYDYLQLFAIIDEFGVKGVFCDYLWLFIGVKSSFLLKMFLLSLVV